MINRLSLSVNRSKIKFARLRLTDSYVESSIAGLHDKIRNNNPGMIPLKERVQNPIAKPGDFAPKACEAKRVFPDWYKPYLSNYYGHGYLLSVLFLSFFIAYVQYKKYLFLKQL